VGFSSGENNTSDMVNYARERAIEVLKTASTAVLATTGPAGVQVGEFFCEAVELDLYLLLPRTSDHLFNLEQDSRVGLHTDQWELTGKGRALSLEEERPEIALFSKSGAAWYVPVKILPGQIQVLRSEGWGAAETIDLASFE
jgi:hypothetical protein